ncbi:hypothetical protein B0T10DRAFT_610835 [Thelonectria olida]|uniref:Hydrophobin n=1 Tax=Thelonectria olida TaxID=1576542 RepID=A0A9P8VT20_9HYPO|nr:hypothetical protein B0T10DRAFT_610835 [Thelonectria olida]
MKTSAVLSALTMAVVAIAAPAEIEARRNGGGGGGGNCNSNQKAVCCNNILGIDLLHCTVGLVSCGGDVYCCTTTAPDGLSINVQAFTCGGLLS